MTTYTDERRELTALATTRSRLGVVVALLAASGVAWWSTVERMSGMDAAAGADLGSLGWFAGVWAVMMAAMMLPSFAPTAAAYASTWPRRACVRSLLFAGGYMLAWGAVGLVAYGLFELGKSGLASELAWHRGGRWVAAAVLGIGAAYELTPLKAACLTRCRSGLRSSASAAPDRRLGAIGAGIRAGGWCIGCSWALMAALFALGVMSLTWMAVIAVLVALEKLSPWRSAATAATAALLLTLAVGLLAAPHSVPGLVVRSSVSSMHAMSMGK